MLSRTRGTQWTTVARRAFFFYGPTGSTHEDLITKTYRTERPCQSHRFCSMNAAPNYHSNRNNKPSRSSVSSSARSNTLPSLWQAALVWRKFLKLQKLSLLGADSKCFGSEEEMPAKQRGACFVNAALCVPPPQHAPAIYIQNQQEKISSHNRNATTTTQWLACINQGKQTALKLTAFPSHLSGLNGFAGEHVISVE